MFNSISPEDQAFYLSRLIYRDTKIEDYHHNQVVLGMEVYDDMINVVDRNIKKVQRYHRKMINIQTERDADIQLLHMPFAEQNEFIDYVYRFNFLSKCRCNWAPPQKIELLSLPKDLAKFILGGHFVECCQKHHVLNDSTMCYINKDIYNPRE